jgi:hypothetical protein
MVNDMKKFLDGVMEWKTGACFMFTASTLVYMVVNLILGYRTLEISSIISLLGISALGTLIQFIAFTDRVIKNVKYTWRLIIFVIPFGAVLTAFAVLFDWFPSNMPGAWLIFIGIFILAFAAMTLGFEIYFRVTGKKYDGLLGQYKKQKGQ